jgi:3-deoxy-D-manno-octulosonate 8-phosphate phosphatase (KDO 8-P phosphatase)
MSERLEIRMFGMDVDGVLTDGGVYHGNGGLELKRFHVQDGMGITLLRKAGIVPFIITARRSAAVARRAVELAIDEVHQGTERKMERLREIVERQGVDLDRVAFIGDDLSDYEVLTGVGFPIAVANAREEVKRVARLVTRSRGGRGAVREACEHVLRACGHSDLVGLYARGKGGSGEGS